MKMTKANIIWKRTNDSFGLLIDDCNGAFMATVNSFNPDGSLLTTVSWPFQTFDGCLHFFDRTLTDMGIEANKHAQGEHQFAISEKTSGKVRV